MMKTTITFDVLTSQILHMLVGFHKRVADETGAYGKIDEKSIATACIYQYAVFLKHNRPDAFADAHPILTKLLENLESKYAGDIVVDPENLH